MKFIIFYISFPLLIFSQGMKITHGPYLQGMGENGVTVVWTTNNDALSWVELAPAGDDSFYAAERPRFYDYEHGNKNIGKLHRVTLSGLSPGTEYRYRIFSKEMIGYEGYSVTYGKVVASNVFSQKPYTFKTLNRKKERLAFKVVNDIHAQNSNLKSMLGSINKSNTDLVIFNGDMISTVNHEEEIFSAFMDTSVDLFAKEVPIFYARGNHETRGKASPAFFNYFPTNTGEYYYTFQAGPVFFVVLDSGEDKPDSDIEYSGLACFDEYRSRQKTWLESVTSSAEFKDAPFRIVIVHIPPAGSTWHGTKEVADKFVSTLNNARIDVMLCGHTHDYQFISKGEEKNIDFPILINDDETWLDITVDADIVIRQKDMSGKTLHVHTFIPHPGDCIPPQPTR
ncbi:MAG: FN3 domain-containing metallophosphoesterase family protein [Eubacteriales bacterium]|nr:FN3 domain-containing metallophosphoesterase family protein [Eubacteriales bacterium]